MNPLSPFTYYWRHKRHAMMLVALIALGTLGLFVMVSMLDSLVGRLNSSYLSQVSYVAPLNGQNLETGLQAQIQAHPAVEKVIPVSSLSIRYPSLLGQDPLQIFGVTPEEAEILLLRAGLRISVGRMFAPRSNEIVISGSVARALNLSLGDEIDRTVDKKVYAQIASPLKVVGILEPEIVDPGVPAPVFGFISDEYLTSHEAYQKLVHGLLIVPQIGQLTEVNVFLESQIDPAYTEVETIDELRRIMSMALQALYVIFGLVNSLVAVIMALVVAAINRIALLQRIDELGVLNALGFSRGTLTRRMVAETAIITLMGWLVGLAISLGFLALLRDQFFYPRGISFNIWTPAPFLFVIPIPVAVIISAWLSIRKVFTRLDAVQIVERGELSDETGKAYKKVRRSTTRPLASRTFYQRHSRRAIGLVATMALMILGVAFPAFLMLTSLQALEPTAETYRGISEVFPVQGHSVEIGLAGQVRGQAEVEQVIPAIPLYMGMNVPPLTSTSVNIYAVREQDLPILMTRMGIFLAEGQLPRPRTNEMVIAQALATNRGLKVGDRIGGPEYKTELDTDGLPVEMVITGILGPDLPWVGFASYEFIASHEYTQDESEYLLVLSRPGQEAALQAWLEKNAETSLTRVRTYALEMKISQEAMTTLGLAFAVIESLIALVAAIALAALNYIFFNQRRTEFGILNALGRSRLWMIGRVFRETGSISLLAWLCGAAVCLLGLALAQAFIYAPIGLNANFANPIPWSFTLPIPLAVVLVSTATIARMLARLDPVAIVEMKA